MKTEFVINKEENQGVISFEGNLGIQHASEVKETILAGFENVDKLLLNLEQVSDIDLACIQVLYSAYKTTLSNIKELSVRGDCPADVLRAVDDAGFANYQWLCFGEA